MTHVRNSLLALTAVLFALPLAPAPAESQQDGARFRILVANPTPTDGTRNRFGERTGNELREILDLPRHVAIGSRQIDQAAREYDLRLNDLDCITARQLAAQIDVPIVFCGEYHQEDGMIQFSGQFVTVPDGDEFEVEAHAFREGDTDEAARHILESFERTADRLNQIQFCGVEYSIRNWEEALQYCSRAIELTPESTEARYALARTLMELEDFEESLEQFQILIEESPNSNRYLENAGWVAAQVGEADLAHDYYSRFLANNPNNVQVRMRLAYDLAMTGDFQGAVDLLEEGFEGAPDNVDLHESYGTYAFRAALDLQQGGPTIQPAQDAEDPLEADAGAPPPGVDDGVNGATDDDASMNSEIGDLFRSAIRSLEIVLEERGPETSPGYVINSMRAYLQLDEPDEAVAFGERALEYFGDDPQVLSQLSNAYGRAGNVDRSIELLEEALAIQPELPNARARMGTRLLEAGEVDLAIDWIHQAAEAGEQTPDVLARMLFGHGWNHGARDGDDYQLALELFEAAREFDISDEFRSELNFFQGYSLYQWANQRAQAQNLESAQTTLPMFREVLEYLDGAGNYAQRAGQGQALNSIQEASQTQITVQEAIIQRESRR